MSEEMLTTLKMLASEREVGDHIRDQGKSGGVQYQLALASLEIVFPSADSSLAEDKSLSEELQRFIQEMADKRFGKDSLSISVELRGGSLTLVAVILAGGYTFFKDYKGLHDGVIQFKKDVEAAGGKIRSIIDKHKKANK
jgi:hypothetical protein